MARTSAAPVISLVLLGVLSSGSAAAAGDEEADRDALRALAPAYVRDLCFVGPTGDARCLGQVVSNEAGLAVLAPTPAGLGPRDLQSAYRLPAHGAAGKIVAAILPPYDYVAAEADLAVYRSHFGLAPCTSATGCFRKIDQEGGTHYPAASGCSANAALSAVAIQAVSATCPDCRIVLIEPSSASDSDLGAALATAIRLGAVAVSATYREAELPEDVAEEAIFDGHSGVLITVPGGAGYPATSAGTIAVGGTTLTRSTSTRGWAEAAWGAGDCSSMIAKPAWQTDSTCATRAANDVAAVADPATGVAFYCTDPDAAGGWGTLGGMSVPPPIVAGAFTALGLADGHFSPAWVWSHPHAFFDITTSLRRPAACSSPLLCTAAAGYDAPTGWGSPNGEALLSLPAPAAEAAPVPGGKAFAAGGGCSTPGRRPADGPAPGLAAALALAAIGIRRRSARG